MNDAISALQQNGQYAADASHDDVMSAYTSIDKPGRLASAAADFMFQRPQD